MVGGYWTTDFRTYGLEKELVITPVESTVFGEDIVFDSLMCGSNKLSPQVFSNSIVYSNWSCNEKAYFKVKVLTSGKHVLEFKYGNDVEYSYNFAGEEKSKIGQKYIKDANTECWTTANGETKCVATMGKQRFAQYKNKTWGKLHNVVKLKNNSYDTIELSNPECNTNIQFMTLSPANKIVFVKANIGLDVDIKPIATGYKWTYSLKLPNDKFVSVINISSDCHIDLLDPDSGTVNIGTQQISFRDVLDYNFTVNSYKKDYNVIVELRKNYVQHNIKNGDILVIDPTVTLQDADTENLEDSYVQKDSPDWNTGSATYLVLQESLSERQIGFIKFNLSSIEPNSIIDSSYLYWYCIQNRLDDSGENPIWEVHEVSNQSWGELEITWNNKPTTGSSIYTNDSFAYDDVNMWVSWNVTSWTKTEFETNSHTNVSFSLTDEQTEGEIGLDWQQFTSKEYTTDTSLRPYLNVTYTLIFAPTYSDNSTNTTLAGQDTLFSLNWTDETGLSGYIFSFYNGSNTSYNPETADIESGEIEIIGELTVASNTTVFSDDAESWSGDECGGDNNPWTTCTAGEGDIYRNIYEHSGTYAVKADDFDIATRALQQTVSFAGYDAAWLNFWWCGYSIPSGDYYGRLEVYDGSYNTVLEINSGNDQSYSSPSPERYTHSIINITSYGLGDITEISWSYKIPGASDYVWFDDFYVYGETFAVTDTEANKSYTAYNDVSLTGIYITNITVTVYVSVYNSSASTENENNNPDLWLELYDGSNWVNIGNMSVTGTGNSSLSSQNQAVLDGWESELNRDLRIKGRYFDGTASNKDNINYTGLWVEVDSHDEFINDTVASFTGLTNWSNVTKSVNTTTGATIKWKIYANDTNDNWNTSLTYSYLTTSSAVNFFNITLPDDSEVKSSESGTATTAVEFNITTGCSQKNIVPCVVGGSCQDDTHPFKFENTGTSSESWNIKLNETISCFTIFGSLSSTMSSSFEINGTWYIINSSIPASSTEELWIKGNATLCTTGDAGAILLTHNVTN
jgi:hypothetical protein